MKREEFARFAMALKTYYPRENLLPNDKACELWFLQLQDIPYQIAETALNKWVALNKWSPTIAEIRESAAELMGGNIPDWGEAWEEVIHAIRKYGSYRTREALESLSPMTRKATERIGFKELCMSENLVADRAQFRQIYEKYIEKRKREQQTPTGIKQMEQKLIERGQT